MKSKSRKVFAVAERMTKLENLCDIIMEKRSTGSNNTARTKLKMIVIAAR